MVESGCFSPLGVEEISIVETELMNRRAFDLIRNAIFSKLKDKDADTVIEVDSSSSVDHETESSSILSSMELRSKLMIFLCQKTM